MSNMVIIEVIYKSEPEINYVETQCFTSADKFQEWKENYPEYTILEILEYDLDDDIGDIR